MLTLLSNATSTLGYSTHVDDGCRQKLCIENCDQIIGDSDILNRVVKRSSDLQTTNFKFEFVFGFQPFDIQIQTSLISRRRFCLESGVPLLQRCDDFFVLCRPSIKRCPSRVCLPLPSSPFHTAATFNYSPSCTAPLAHVVY